MPQLAAQTPGYCTDTGFNYSFDLNDEAVTSQDAAPGRAAGDYLRTALREIYASDFWVSKARFAAARQRLTTTASLERGWDTYDAESPNDRARALAAKILNVLEADLLPPTCLMPSSEGGIAISFVDGDNRAEIEIYNTGEVAAATYSAHSGPVAWELKDTESALKKAIRRIRVHLAA